MHGDEDFEADWILHEVRTPGRSEILGMDSTLTHGDLLEIRGKMRPGF